MAGGVTGRTETNKKFFTFTKHGAVPVEQCGARHEEISEPAKDTIPPEHNKTSELTGNPNGSEDVGISKRSTATTVADSDSILPPIVYVTTETPDAEEITATEPMELSGDINMNAFTEEIEERGSCEKTQLKDSLDLNDEDGSNCTESLMNINNIESSPEDCETIQVYDDGYHSASGKSSPCFEEPISRECEEDSSNENLRTFFMAENILDIEGLEFQLASDDSGDLINYVVEDLNTITSVSNNVQTLDNLVHDSNDSEMADFLTYDSKRLPNNFELTPMGTLKCKKKSKKDGKLNTISSKISKRGAKRLPKEELTNTWHNVVRCREYRIKKKEKEFTEMSELDTLEERFRELTEQEQRMKEKIDRLRSSYLRMISEGKVVYMH